ncbi:MAG: hypothetical protein WBD95_12120 [Xanthobacteraceae bacterium]
MKRSFRLILRHITPIERAHESAKFSYKDSIRAAALRNVTTKSSFWLQQNDTSSADQGWASRIFRRAKLVSVAIEKVQAVALARPFDPVNHVVAIEFDSVARSDAIVFGHPAFKKFDVCVV